ncbi:hypothetical protein TVAG_286970 [Trichomonas vaginalis G3]|uniref:Uncharacterized protein n=1 Tax=Trichomonas vaginalis (strain ATCC PRA-98 / G3) TaxID=412133 RepID=A2F3I0_TRIV3|nr:hypothetical protein TVAGG3_0245510 [Trichomonas vaginalis G3]EAY00560.1 hypothetical protein TVAG_286970 [Trichomonas vaginalis G3]KAI5553630.1 hypothetical protein TVAGG3_0245510 [Trichomonas vaginalis G3]|eukprot:XP_001313489.1 hypothetical protein [Trichomonas vaginalis G3]
MSNTDTNSVQDTDFAIKKTRTNPSEVPPQPDESFENIIEGANDLMNLPIQNIRDELKKRNFHAGIVDKMDQRFLVSMLREAVEMDTNYNTNSRSKYRIHGGNSSGPIFSSDSNPSKDPNSSPEEDQKNDQDAIIQEFDEAEFAKNDPDEKLPKSSLINGNKKSLPYLQLRYASRQPESPWGRLDKYVPIDILESLPLETQQKIQTDIRNSVNYGEIIEKYLV